MLQSTAWNFKMLKFVIANHYTHVWSIRINPLDLFKDGQLVKVSAFNYLHSFFVRPNKGFLSQTPFSDFLYMYIQLEIVLVSNSFQRFIRHLNKTYNTLTLDECDTFLFSQTQEILSYAHFKESLIYSHREGLCCSFAIIFVIFYCFLYFPYTKWGWVLTYHI